VLVCASCGTENRQGARFCNACGASLDAQPSAPVEERKVVSVLFCDLVGFTAASEAVDPEDVRARIRPYHSRLREVIEQFGGTVEKFVGDAVMAVFGAPVAHEDDAERAVRAGFRILEAIEDMNVTDPALSLQVRVGINTGEAVVALGARPEAGEGLVTGDVVNTASRLQGAAPVNGILVGEATFRATEQRIEYREHEAVAVKGKSRPVPVFEAVAARSRIVVERMHGASLVGRRRELDLLEGALARVLEERSCQLVTLVGVPGVGKSRLVFELSEAVQRRPELISWRQGRCLPYGEGVTFWALGEIVKGEVGILEGDPPGEAERKLAAAARDPWVEAHLRPLVGLAAESEGGGDARSEAFAGWRRFFERLAEERPLVLVFEDLHWADDHLLDFIDELVEWTAGVPFLVVCTGRPELLSRRPGWGGGKPNALTISLPPLSDEDTARLLVDLLGGLVPAELQVELLARAGGNPLYAEEFARIVRDRGLSGELPETVQGLIAARLDLLEPQQKALVQNAAVIGKRFWQSGLAALARLDEHELEAGLHGLQRKEFVQRERESSVADDTEFAFLHVLVREVAYAQIPRANRAEKHLETAAWIEGLGRREDHAEMLAHHYLQALEWTRAAGGDTTPFAGAARTALSDAGDRAYALNAYDAAGRFYRGALELAPDGDGERGRLLLRLGRALYVNGQPEPDLLEQARDHFLAAGDNGAAAEAEAALSELYWLSGERDRGAKRFASARELAETLPTSPTKARVFSLGSRFLMLASEDADAIALGEQALDMAQQLGLEEIKAATLNNLGSARLNTGDSERGLHQLEEAIAVARQANNGEELCRALNNVAAYTFATGSEKLEVVMELHREGLQEAERYGQRGYARWQEAQLADRAYESGLWEEALSRADQFLTAVEAGSAHYLTAECYSARASIRLGRNEPDAALQDIDQAVTHAERGKDPQLLYPNLARAAHILSELGHAERAASFADTVLQAVEENWAGFTTTASHVAAWTISTLGHGARLATALEAQPATPWVRAGIAYAQDDPLAAAEICSQIGAATQEAYARLNAAKMLIEQGQRALGDEQLNRALSFYRSVAATHYIRQAETLLAASA
jgi:class 3 adenylate cyclase